MKIAKARNIICIFWLGGMVSLLFMFELAPITRKGIISPYDAHAALIKALAMYVPVITTFVTFWFRPGRIDRRRTLRKDKWYMALAFSGGYQLILLAFFFAVIYLVKYEEVEPVMSFNERVSNVMQIGLIFSPIATAPAAFLLGVEQIDIPMPKKP